jgi:hypothetical protein
VSHRYISVTHDGYIVYPNIVNPDIVNPHIVNPDIINPHIVNPHIAPTRSSIHSPAR